MLLLVLRPISVINMPVIKHIGVLSLAKIEALGGVVIGLIIGIVFAVIGVAASRIPSVGLFGAGLGALSIIVFPIIYGVLMFISGAIIALLYNLFAGWVGGVELKW
jgi:hypothetical protein